MSTPLAYGQLSVFRVLQTYPLERWSETYLSEVVPVPPGTTVSQVDNALRTVAQRHESLRTLFAAAGPVQIVPPTGDYDIAVLEVADLPRLRQEASLRRFDWECEFGWRAVISTQMGMPTNLILVVDHIVADRWGLNRLCAELTVLMGGSDERGKAWLEQQPPQPCELAIAQRTSRRNGLTYWQRLLRELPESIFPWPAPPGDAGRIEATLHSPRARQTLGLAAYRLGVSPQSVLLTLQGLAAACLFQSEQVVLTLQSSNRFDKRWRDIVTSTNQYTPLPVTPVGDIRALAQTVHWAGLNAYRNGSYDLDEVGDLVRRERGMSLDFDGFFNYLADDVVATSGEGALTSVASSSIERSHPRRQVGPRYDVKVRGGDALSIVVRVDPSLLSADGLDRLLLWFDDELARLAVDPVRRVEDIMTGLR